MKLKTLEIIAWHKEELQKARIEALWEAVDLADKIESREPDGGTKQWMAFKAFRNTLRDRIKELTQSELDQPTV